MLGNGLRLEVPYLLAQHLVENADTAPIKQWLAQGEVWVAPVVNPDGHEFTRQHDRLWRKNRRPNPDGSRGVDPNRNYGICGEHSTPTSPASCPATNVGPRAFCEPETRAVRDLIGRELFRGVVTYHSYSQLILWPWGHTRRPIADPGDRQLPGQLAQRMQQLIRGVHGMTYTPEQSSELYPTAGDTTDWTYGIYGIPSSTVELRPHTQADGGFILPPGKIQPT